MIGQDGTVEALRNYNEARFKTASSLRRKQNFLLNGRTLRNKGVRSYISTDLLGIDPNILERFRANSIVQSDEFVRQSQECSMPINHPDSTFDSVAKRFLALRPGALHLKPILSQRLFFPRVRSSNGGSKSPTKREAVLIDNSDILQFNSYATGGLFSQADQDVSFIWNFLFIPEETSYYRLTAPMWFYGSYILNSHNHFYNPSQAFGWIYSSGAYVSPLESISISAGIEESTSLSAIQEENIVFQGGGYNITQSGVISDVELPIIDTSGYGNILAKGVPYAVGFSASIILDASGVGAHAQFSFDAVGQGVGCPWVSIESISIP